MKRLVLFAVLCSLLLLISCGPVEQKCEKPFIQKDGQCCLDLDEDGQCDSTAAENKTTTQEEPEVVVEETKEIEIEKKKAEKPKETEIVEEEEPEETTEELTEKDIKEFESASVDAAGLLKQLMKTYSEKVEGYKYNYQGNWYLVRGDKIKILLGNSKQYSGQDVNGTHYATFFVDTVYLDTIDKTSTGYCEGNDPSLGNRRCAELELTDIPLQLSYSDFYTKRPDEWLFEVYTLDPEVKTETGYYYLGPRKARRLEYNDGVKQVIMYYDEKIGLPVKVQTFINGQPSETWLYDFLSANTVLEKHVRHRTAEEISNKEAFYSTSH